MIACCSSCASHTDTLQCSALEIMSEI